MVTARLRDETNGHPDLRTEPDPHEPWLTWRVWVDNGPNGRRLRLQECRMKIQYWSDYPNRLDFPPTPQRCILWLSLYSNPYKPKELPNEDPHDDPQG